MRNRNSFRFYCALILLLLAADVSAQIKCKIEHYSTEGGLSHDGVTTMLKDRDGFMWFGTWDGINRFDGHNFVSYKTRPGDSSTLKSNRIDNIVEDKDGYLWLSAYDNQIYRFNKQNGSFLAISDMLEKKNIRNILFNNIVLAGKGFVWLKTPDRGVFGVRNTKSGPPEIIRYAAGLKGGFQLPSNRVNFLYTDKEQNVWLGTDKGIVRLSAGQSGIYRNIKLPADFEKNIAYTCIAENKNNIWLGTSTGDLICYDKSSHRLSRKKVADKRLNAILFSKDKNVLYLSAASEVVTVNIPGLETSTSSMPGVEGFLSLYEDKSGLLWIEAEAHGVIKYNPVAGKFKYFFQNNDANFLNRGKEYKIFEDHKGRVWMSMKGGGFGYYNPVKDVIEYFYNKPGAADHQFSNMITCSYFDPVGILWLSTRDRGIDKILFQDNDFRYQLLTEHTLNKSDNEVRGIYSDQNDCLWLASKSGSLYVYDHGKKVTDIFVNEPAGGIGLVYTILQDTKGAIWLGTKGNGLFKAEPVGHGQPKYRLIHYQNDKNDSNSLSSDLVYSLLEDRKGRIWVGTYEHGLNLVIQNGTHTRFANANNTFKNYPKGSWDKIRHLQEDANGKLWVATTHGLVIFDPGKGKPDDYQFLRYGKIPGDKNSLGNNDVQYIYRDTRNRMWVATSGGGLNKVVALSEKGLKFRVFTKEDGLPSDYILSIIEDNSGNLWLGTENGISKFNPGRLAFTNYDSYDGLPKTGFSEGSSLKLPNGDLLFGCINGYLTFSPGEITGQKIRTKMALTNLQINNKDVDPDKKGSPLKIDINETKEIDLNYNENIISIDFTVLDYRSSNKQAYAYRLNGFDAEWHNVKNQRKATYTNLPPGDYLFEVKSLNTDLYENMPAKTLAIKIAPPPWRTVWAYLLYAILLIVLVEITRRIVFTMIRLRNRIAVEQKLTELKLSFFTHISHELRTPLTLIVNPIEEIYRQENLSAKGYEYINVVRKNANRMVRFINQLLDFRKAQSGKMNLRIAYTEMVAFVNDIGAYFSEVSREKHVELLIVSNVKELFAWIDPEKIDIVIYNLLSNAFKFSPDNKTIRVEINHDPGEDFFTIDVIDQGTGVPQDKLNDIFELYYEVDKKPGTNLEGTGIGLALCKEITGFHHGNIEACNNPSAGLAVTLTLKLGKEHFKDGEVVVSDTAHAVKSALLTPADMSSMPDDPAVTDNADMPLVLIVDDNNELRKFLADQLKEFYRVIGAIDGEEGLDMAFEYIPDLILSDVMMPKLDGIQMLDQLKNNMLTSHIPVVLLTAKSSIENQIEGLRYGADYYITKPFQTDFILASIDNLLKLRKKIFESFLSNKKTMELSPGEIFITSKDEIFLKETISIVENGMVDPEFNIDVVAESIGMGRTTFYKKFKSLTDLAPVEFVREMRLKRAKQLLEAGENNISEIAYAVGFNSAKYFSTCFKEEYGMSPSVYLKLGSAKTV
jgi:ligand-binding sensor domain-containing protein/signal transduction histidine kinase/AraC-like DNA-binding protein